MNTMRRTDIVGTGRDKPLVYAMVAEVTFVGDVPIIIKGNGIIRTGVDARLATGA